LVEAILWEQCYQQNIGVQPLENVTVISLFALVGNSPQDFLHNHQNLQLPPWKGKFNTLYIDVGNFSGRIQISYPDEWIEAAAQMKFDAVVVKNFGDLTFMSYASMRFWIKKTCSIPLYLVEPPNSETAIQLNSSGLSDHPVALVNLDFQENLLKIALRNPGLIIGYAVPSYVIILAMIHQACKKLYFNNFPRTRNAGSILCTLGICLALLSCKLPIQFLLN
jgi:hypothetical protein